MANDNERLVMLTTLFRCGLLLLCVVTAGLVVEDIAGDWQRRAYLNSIRTMNHLYFLQTGQFPPRVPQAPSNPYPDPDIKDI